MVSGDSIPDRLQKSQQHANLERLARNKGFKFTQTFFPYTSGQIGPYYVNSECVTANGEDYDLACRDMAISIQLITFGDNTNVQFISGGESRDWVFSYPVSTKLVTPHFSIYKDGKTFGANISGQTGVHVADLNNEGSSPRDSWIPAIKKAGGNVNHIFFYVDRLEDGVEEMAKLGLQSHAVVPLNAAAWDYLQQINVVTPEVYRNLRERGATREERDVWARRMLRSKGGLGTLAKLAMDEKTAEKAKKILIKGYPEMKIELVDRMLEERIISIDRHTYLLSPEKQK